MRKAQTREHYENELLYVALIDPKNPGDTFNNDPECFKRYAQLQSNLAIEDGFATIGRAILDEVTHA